MPDYSKGRIYAIRAPGTDEVYIGSSTLPLNRRFQHHKAAFKCYAAGIGWYCASYQILKHEGAYIELIEEFPCNTKEQLNKREGELIRSTQCVNRNIPCRTAHERRTNYYQQNKEQELQQQKEYREANREKIKAQKRAAYHAAKHAAFSSNQSQPQPLA